MRFSATGMPKFPKALSDAFAASSMIAKVFSSPNQRLNALRH